MPDLPLPDGYSREVLRGVHLILLDRCRAPLTAFFSTPLDAWRAHPSARAHAGKGRHFSVDLPGDLGRGFVRCWTRGGGVSWLGRWFAGMRRPIDELRATVRARALDIPLPEPLAVCAEEGIFGYRLTTVSREVESVGEIPAVLGAFSAPDGESSRTVLRRALACRLGELVGRLHRGGLFPLDLHLRNALVTRAADRPEICLVDLDPVRQVSPHGPAPERRDLAAASLGRLVRSARRWSLARLRIDPADYARFARAYARGAGLDVREASSLFRAALRVGLRGRRLQRAGGRDARGVIVRNGAGVASPAPDPGRVLVKMPNWLGDVVMALPLLEGIRRRWPRAGLAVLVNETLQGLFELSPDPVEVIAADRRAPGLAPDRARRDGYDLTVTVPRSLGAALRARRCGGAARVGFDGPFRRWCFTHRVRAAGPRAGAHRVDVYWTLGAPLGFGPFPPAPRLRVPEPWRLEAVERLARAGIRDGDILVAALARRLGRRPGVRLLLFGSTVEAPLAESIAREAGPAALSFAGATTLPQLAALIAACRAFVTNDTGPMHVAAALGVPVVAIFGSTDPVATGPYGPGHRVVRVPVPCSPCLLRRCPIDFRCMARVEPERVVEAIDAALSAGLPARRAAAP
jgi:heptosyltransferase-2